MKAMIYVIVAAVGLLQPVQSGMNAALRTGLGNTWLAGTWIVLLEVAGFLVLFALLRGSVPSWSDMAALPWWAPLGGLLGIVIVYAMLAYAGQIGAGPFNGIMVTSGIVASLLLDHYGLFGFQEHAVNLWRLVGGLLMIAGVLLIAIF